LQHEARLGPVHPLDAYLPGGRGVALEPDRDERLVGRGLHPPLRERDVTETVRGEQAVRDLRGLEEADHVGDDGIRRRPRHGGHALAAWARFSSTTAMVACRASVGLNSTTEVPPAISGR